MTVIGWRPLEMLRLCPGKSPARAGKALSGKAESSIMAA